MRFTNKYGNTKVEYAGIKFDSKKECGRYVELLLMQESGAICELTVKPVYELIPSQKTDSGTMRALKYTPDFRYVQDGQVVVEDVKGYDRKTGKYLTTEAYKIKKKLLYERYKLLVREV